MSSLRPLVAVRALGALGLLCAVPVHRCVRPVHTRSGG